MESATVLGVRLNSALSLDETKTGKKHPDWMTVQESKLSSLVSKVDDL